MKTMVVDDCLVMSIYLSSTKHSLGELGRMLADIETTGGAGDKASPMLRRCTGRVLDVHEERPGVGVVQLGLPLENLNWDNASSAFASMYLYMIGGASMAWMEYEQSKLLDFSLPDKALAIFPGPRWGAPGTRKWLHAAASDLLVGTIVKPTAGLTPAEVAHLCGQAAEGGMKFIKDDEKMANPPYCPLVPRVRAVVEAMKAAQDKSGNRCLYAPHITTGPDQIVASAHAVLELGASALMVNMFAAGFHSLMLLRTQIPNDVPIYGHCGGKEAMCRAENQGVSMEVVAKFARLMGADYFRIGLPGGYLVGNSDQDLRGLFAAMTAPLGPVPAMMPACSGGLKPANLGGALEMFGDRAMYLAGTGITKHPQGVAAGVLALQQAAEAFRKNVPVQEYAKTHEALKTGLTI